MAVQEAPPAGPMPLEDFGPALLYSYAVNLREQDALERSFGVLDNNIQVVSGVLPGELVGLPDPANLPGVTEEIGQEYTENLQSGDTGAIVMATRSLFGVLSAERHSREEALRTQTLPDGTPLATANVPVVVEDTQGMGIIKEVKGGKPRHVVQGELAGVELTDRFLGGSLYVRGINRGILHPKGRLYAVKGLINEEADYTPNIDLKFR